MLNDPKTTRRTALRNLAEAAAVSALPIFGQDKPPESTHTKHPITKEAAKEYRFVFFQPHQMETLEALTETIIPADAHSPGAKAARVSEYIDSIVADASPSTQAQWNEGLAGIDKFSMTRFARTFGKCTAQQQIEILGHTARNEDHPKTADERFFVGLKRATIDGYYTSRIGIHQDLQYQGNAALVNFPTCTDGETR